MFAHLIAVFLFVVPFPVRTADLCEGERVWYDVIVGICRSCSDCDSGKLEVIPCTSYEDAVCFDLRQLYLGMRLSAEEATSGGGSHDGDVPSDNSGGLPRNAMVTSAEKSGRSIGLLASSQSWNVASLVLCSLVVFAVLVIIVVVVLKFRHSRSRKRESRMLSTRARLFSRDRLDTTEYMNNLATLDRKLAMDEILEKRRRVIFTPSVACDTNLDEVFICGLTMDEADEQTSKLITTTNTTENKWTGFASRS